MKRIFLDFNNFETPSEVHAYLRKELGSPEYFGSNLDALHDVLTSLHEEVLFYLTRIGHPMEEGFVHVMKDAAAENYHLNVYGASDIQRRRPAAGEFGREMSALRGETDGEIYDVIVAGGGPAGIGAAVAAALCGARTLLLESRSFFGGIAATSLFMPMNRMRLQGGSRGGVHDELIKELEKYGEKAFREGKVTWTDGDGLHVHPEYLKMAVFDLLDRVHCDYYLYSPVTAVRKAGKSVTAALVRTKQGEKAFCGKVFIDCSGDGDMAAAAGARFELGNETNGSMMPVTLGFALANVDTDRLFSWYDAEDPVPKMADVLRQAEEEGYSVSKWYSFDRTTIPNVASVNNGGLKDIGTLNVMEPSDATKAEKAGLKLALDFVEIVRKFKIPGLENCALDRTGAAVGVRESRRILCDYVLTYEDALNGTEFEDIIARRYGALDQAGLSEVGVSMKSGYGYPYRALLVRDLDNVMAAGKCGSYTHLALAAGKSMGNMMAIGQAAGIGAALAVSEGITPREVDYRKVQEKLLELGVQL